MNIKILLVLILTICSNKLYSQTELYKQYEHRTEFTVMCIMQYPITDSAKTDITLFVPHDKEGILPMLQEFNITNLNKDTVLNRYENGKVYPLCIYNVYADDIKKKYEKKANESYKNMSKLVYSYHAGMIMIFHDIETEERNRKVTRYLLNAVKKPLVLPNE